MWRTVKNRNGLNLSGNVLVAIVNDVCIVEHDQKNLASEVATSSSDQPEKGQGTVHFESLCRVDRHQARYRLLAGDRANRVKWPQVQFYFGDERCVPPDHAESNFKLANDTLFRPLGIDAAQVFRIEGEAGQPDLAARRYEETIRQQFGIPFPAWPRFDLIFLGLGDDGHTASLFPGSPALGEKVRAVVISKSPRGVTHRITLTAPLINHARSIVFMVAGSQSPRQSVPSWKMTP